MDFDLELVYNRFGRLFRNAVRNGRRNSACSLNSGVPRTTGIEFQSAMNTTKPTATDMLDREFLEIRCRILDIAAALDRIDRASGAGTAASDPRLDRIRESAAVLLDGGADRARRVQMVFSEPYDDTWRGT